MRILWCSPLFFLLSNCSETGFSNGSTNSAAGTNLPNSRPTPRTVGEGEVFSNDSNALPALAEIKAQIASSAPLKGNGKVIPVEVRFTEPVNGLEVSDFIIENGEVSGLSGSGQAYQLDWKPLTDGKTKLSIKEGAARNSRDIKSKASNSLERWADLTPPKVLKMSSVVPFPSSLKKIPVVLEWSEPVEGFEGKDLVVPATSTVENFRAVGPGLFEFDFLPTQDGEFEIKIPKEVVLDEVGNPNREEFSWKNTLDFTPPSVVVSSPTSDPFGSGNMVVEVRFSEKVDKLAPTSLEVVNGLVENWIQSDNSITFGLKPVNVGLVSITVPSNVTKDSAGNFNLRSNTVSKRFDSNRLLANLTTTSNLITNSTLLDVKLQLTNKTLVASSLTKEDFKLEGGTVKNITAGSGSQIYAVSIQPSVSQGSVKVKLPENSVLDTTGLGNLASNELVIEIDRSQPSPTLSSNSSVYPTNSRGILVNVSFTEPVSGFDASKVTLPSGYAVQSFVKSTNSNSYQFQVVPPNSVSQALIEVKLLAGAAVDRAGNPSLASNVLNLIFDAVPPVPTLNAENPLAEEWVPVEIRFNEDVSQFDWNKVQLNQLLIQNKVVVNPKLVRAQVKVSGGTVGSLLVMPGAARDGAGNLSTISNSIVIQRSVVGLTERTLNVDLLLALDNSGSMSGAIAQVKTHLSSLIEKLKKSNIRMGLTYVNQSETSWSKNSQDIGSFGSLLPNSGAIRYNRLQMLPFHATGSSSWASNVPLWQSNVVVDPEVSSNSDWLKRQVAQTPLFKADVNENALCHALLGYQSVDSFSTTGSQSASFRKNADVFATIVFSDEGAKSFDRCRHLIEKKDVAQGCYVHRAARGNDTYCSSWSYKTVCDVRMDNGEFGCRQVTDRCLTTVPKSSDFLPKAERSFPGESCETSPVVASYIAGLPEIQTYPISQKAPFSAYSYYQYPNSTILDSETDDQKASKFLGLVNQVKGNSSRGFQLHFIGFTGESNCMAPVDKPYQSNGTVYSKVAALSGGVSSCLVDTSKNVADFSGKFSDIAKKIETKKVFDLSNNSITKVLLYRSSQPPVVLSPSNYIVRDKTTGTGKEIEFLSAPIAVMAEDVLLFL